MNQLLLKTDSLQTREKKEMHAKRRMETEEGFAQLEKLKRQAEQLDLENVKKRDGLNKTERTHGDKLAKILSELNRFNLWDLFPGSKNEKPLMHDDDGDDINDDDDDSDCIGGFEASLLGVTVDVNLGELLTARMSEWKKLQRRRKKKWTRLSKELKESRSK